MGEAIIKGLLGARLLEPRAVHVHDPLRSRMDYLENRYGIVCHNEPGRLLEACDTVILAVKPQNMGEVLAKFGRHGPSAPLVISIAAGIPLPALTAGLPAGTPIVRVMPNTPALVLEGASALSRGPGVTDAMMEKAVELFRAVGKTVEVEEKWMDAVTGLSGSGPGYFLLLMESLIDGGVLMGLPRPVARELVVQTALGTAKLIQETGKHPAELKDMVTSPGGTTIAGIQVMEENGVRGALMGAVEAATLKSRELGKPK
jgi:pyrroline-5-carboxylate reductase